MEKISAMSAVRSMIKLAVLIGSVHTNALENYMADFITKNIRRKPKKINQNEETINQ